MVDDHRAILLVDHDNIPVESLTLVRIVQKWVASLPKDNADVRRVVSAKVRVYGGWYSQHSASEARYAAASLYQQTCPALIAFENTYCHLSFEFADFLIESRGLTDLPAITHTVGRRTKPPYIKAASGGRECPESDCELRSMRKWARKQRACLKEQCPLTFAECFDRLEQKQVDVHIATDLVSLADGIGRWTHVAIVSDDTDLLPAIALAALRNAGKRELSVIRVSSEPRYLDTFLISQGVRIVAIG